MTDSSSGRKGASSNRPGDVLVSNSGKVDTGQRQAHQPNTSNRGKVDTGQRQAHQPNTSNSAQTVKPVETIGSGTAQPQAAARGSSEQATEAQDAIRAEWDTSHTTESSWKRSQLWWHSVSDSDFKVPAMHIPVFFSSTEAKSCEEKVISEPSDFVFNEDQFIISSETSMAKHIPHHSRHLHKLQLFKLKE